MILDYDLATPIMLVHFFPSGMLGLGLTALLASLMSGMAGNTTPSNVARLTASSWLMHQRSLGSQMKNLHGS